jgi:uncharacterized protein YukE
MLLSIISPVISLVSSIKRDSDSIVSARIEGLNICSSVCSDHLELIIMSESAAPQDDSGNGGGVGDSSVWEQAEDDAKLMIFRSAMEDIENKTMKQEEELMQTRLKAEALDDALKVAQAKTEELRQALQAKTEAYDSLQLEYQGAHSKSESLEEFSKLNQERMNRLQVEGDQLREEIR